MRPPHLSRASRIVTRLPARASSRAAIRPADPAPTTTMWSACTLLILGLPAARLVLETIAQQHDPAFPCLAALERHRRDRRTPIGVRVRGVEQAGRALCAIHRRTKQQIQFVDQSLAQEG